MGCVRFGWGDERYREHVVLRDRSLRRPLGLTIEDDDRSGDADALYYGWIDPQGQLRGACQLKVVSETLAYLKQMVVDDAYRGQGVGRAIVRFAECDLWRRHPHATIRLEARVTAVPFYERLGYHTVGAPYVQSPSGVLHRSMETRPRSLACDNEERLRAFFAAENARDWATYRTYLAPDVVYTCHGTVTRSTTGVDAYVRAMVEAYGDDDVTFDVTSLDVSHDGQRIVTRLRNARGDRACDIFWFQDGLIAKEIEILLG